MNMPVALLFISCFEVYTHRYVADLRKAERVRSQNSHLIDTLTQIDLGAFCFPE